jgi:hypothetical protein
MRCTRGDMRRLCFLAATLFALAAWAVFDLADGEDLPAGADFTVFLVLEAGAVFDGALSDCLAEAHGETHRDPLVIAAAMNRMSFREDNTLSLPPEIRSHH